MPESGADLSQLILRHIAAHSFWSPTRRGVKSCKSCKANLRTNLTGTRPITVGHRLQTCKSCCERAFGLFHAERLPMHGGAPIFRENGSVPLFPHLDCMARLLRHLNKPTPKSREIPDPSFVPEKTSASVQTPISDNFEYLTPSCETQQCPAGPLVRGVQEAAVAPGSCQ